MTKRVRLLLLACASVASLALAGSALAAFTPALAIGTQPPTLNSLGTTSIRLTVPRDDDALFRAQIYAPTGYQAVLGQAPGTNLGTVTAQVQVREPIAGAVLPVSGNIIVTDQATVGAAAAQCTGTASHAAYWVLVLQASGQELRVPVFVDPAPAQLQTSVAWVLTVCLPSPHIPVALGGATFGAKLINAQMNVRGVFRTPAVRGPWRWHVVATPWPNGPGLPNAAGTVTAQGRVALPVRFIIRYTARRGVLTVFGSVVEGDQGLQRRPVTIRIGNRNYRVTTTTGGAFRKVVRRKPGTRVAVRVTAAVPARPVACTTPSPFAPVPCVGETLQFWPTARSASIVARIR
jgi:hypothetical protein